jgi:hypothetical protein
MADPFLQKGKKDKEEEKKKKKEEKKKKKEKTETEVAYQGSVYNFLVGLMGSKGAKKPLEKEAEEPLEKNMPDLPDAPMPQTVVPDNLNALMKSDEWQQTFEAWIAAKYKTTETFRFFRDIHRYNADPTEGMVVYIVDTYIDTGIINLDESTRKPIIAAKDYCMQPLLGRPKGPSPVTDKLFSQAAYDMVLMLDHLYLQFKQEMEE